MCVCELVGLCVLFPRFDISSVTLAHCRLWVTDRPASMQEGRTIMCLSMCHPGRSGGNSSRLFSFLLAVFNCVAHKEAGPDPAFGPAQPRLSAVCVCVSAQQYLVLEFGMCPLTQHGQSWSQQPACTAAACPVWLLVSVLSGYPLLSSVAPTVACLGAAHLLLRFGYGCPQPP